MLKSQDFKTMFKISLTRIFLSEIIVSLVQLVLDDPVSPKLSLKLARHGHLYIWTELLPKFFW